MRLETAAGELLVRREETLAVAESCTGGLLAGRITAVAGSSRYFKAGIVAYHNEAKQKLLGVPRALLERHGAVSTACAAAMAAGMRRRAGTDWALSITGVAGPGGGSQRKPVGRVYFGLAGPGGKLTMTKRFPGDRAAVRESAVRAALEWLVENLGR